MRDTKERKITFISSLSINTIYPNDNTLYPNCVAGGRICPLLSVYLGKKKERESSGKGIRDRIDRKTVTVQSNSK